MGLEQSLLHLAGSSGTIREATARQRHTTLAAKRAPRTEEGHCPWRPGNLYFATYELEGASRVGEHRLRHQGQPPPAKEQPERRSSDAE
jgi:hypothetical protein